jgi:phosphohistidine swiveling domain-containing protein
VTEAPNPVHMSSGQARWTTVNFGEAIGGVQTPMSWSVWDYGMEKATRRGFGAMGLFKRDEVAVPDSVDERASGIFFGRAAGNVDTFRLVGDRMPGSSGDVLEEKVFGNPATGPAKRKPLGTYARYPVVVTKFVRAGWSSTRTLPRILEEYRPWWRTATLDDPPSDLESAQRLAAESARRFENVDFHHCVVSMIAPGMLEALTKLADEAVGDPTLGPVLATGYGGMEETQIIEDLWAVSQGKLDIAEVIRRHGFHGPDEGQVDAISWREDPGPIEAVIKGYAEKGLADPREREREQTRRREETEQQVLAGLPRLKRGGAKLQMKMAASIILAREIGKASFLHALDGARCAARAGGAVLAERGVLADPEDVFFLTLQEFTGTPEPSFADTVAERRANHERYLTLQLPPMWTGEPEPIEITPEALIGDGKVERLQGIGVVGDQVTGRARVIRDPTAADLEPGDILVCSMTDPSWTPLFMLADALVIDTGGEISHGAIVARELGVTCVINTGTGTRDIPDGATITVNGSTGTVEIASS